MLKSLLKLLVGVGIAFVLWEIAAPYLAKSQGRVPAPKASSPDADLGSPDEAWECVHQAEQASLDLSAITTSFSPRDGEDRMREQLDAARTVISDANSQCRCLELACDLARQALSELEEVVTAYDQMARGDQGGYSNPASHRERAVTLLERARGLTLK